MRIVEDDLRRAEVRELLERHALGMQENSPQGACHYFDLDALQASDVTVWSIWGVRSLAGLGTVRDLARYTARSTAGR